MDIDMLRDNIKKKRLNGETYESIASELKVSRALVQYIETHPRYRPGRHMRKHLNLKSEVTYTSIRRDKLNEIAKMWGYPSWCAYETDIIKMWLDKDKKNEQV